MPAAWGGAAVAGAVCWIGGAPRACLDSGDPSPNGPRWLLPELSFLPPGGCGNASNGGGGSTGNDVALLFADSGSAGDAVALPLGNVALLLAGGGGAGDDAFPSERGAEPGMTDHTRGRSSKEQLGLTNPLRNHGMT